MFTHDIKDQITVGTFTATLDDFLLLEPSYRLPDGALWQFYVPGSKHLIGYGLYQRDDGPTWVDGDVFLANEAAYATAQPDTSPNVLGFETALIVAFGGDYLAINSLYSGWPLFKDALETAQWALADLLLTNAYVKYEITTAIYTAIITAARANYIPMSLQGRPGLMPLHLVDEARVLAQPTNVTDALAIGLSEAAPYAIIISPIQSNDSILIGASEAVQTVSSTVSQTDDTTTHASDPAPSLVMT